MQKSWGQMWFFSFPAQGGTGILWKEGPATDGPGRGQRLCWHQWEAVHGTKHELSKNLPEGVQHEQCLTSYFSPIIGNVALLSPQGLPQSSATHVYFLFVLFLCACVSKHVPFLPLSSVLRRTTLAHSPPRSWALQPYLSLPPIISRIFHPSRRNRFQIQIKVLDGTEIN